MNDPIVYAAVIAAIVSTFGAAVSVVLARWQIKEGQRKLRMDSQVLQQTLLRDVLARRMTAYSALWHVMVTHDLNHRLEGRPCDAAWATSFLKALNECNAEHGVFFSQSVYETFGEYRACLVRINKQTAGGVSPDPVELERLVALATGSDSKLGLASAMKDDLGSYVAPNLRVGTRVGDV